MVRISFRLLRRGYYRFPGENPESFKHIKHGEVKWRDFKPSYVEPPYWYKWTRASPYSPDEQIKIRTREKYFWYKYNYHKLSYTPPDEWKFFVGDKVEILAGKDKGKQGEVVQIIPQRNWVVVGGLNCKYVKSDNRYQTDEEPLDHSEVSLVDPKTGKSTDIEFRADEHGNLVRASLDSGHIIPKPPEILHDRTPKSEYICDEKDTSIDDTLKRTYVPSMKRWEEELKEIFKINDPPRRKTYFY